MKKKQYICPEAVCCALEQMRPLMNSGYHTLDADSKETSFEEDLFSNNQPDLFADPAAEEVPQGDRLMNSWQ